MAEINPNLVAIRTSGGPALIDPMVIGALFDVEGKEIVNLHGVGEVKSCLQLKTGATLWLTTSAEEFYKFLTGRDMFPPPSAGRRVPPEDGTPVPGPTKDPTKEGGT